MWRLVAVTVIALAARTAAAQPVTGTLRRVAALWTSSQEGEIRQRITQAREQAAAYYQVAMAFLSNNAPTDARFDVFAEAGAGVDARAAAGEGTLGAVFAVRSRRCDLVQVGASLRGDVRSKEPTLLGGAQQWAQLCLSGGLDLGTLMQIKVPGLALFPMVLREGGVLDARPRLTAKRSAIDEPYSDIGFGFDVEGVRYQWRADRGIAGIGFTADQRWRWRGWPGGDDAKVELEGNFWFARLFRLRGEAALADRFVDILVFGFHGIQSDNDAAIVTAWPVRFYGVGFADDRVLVDAELGVGGTGTISSTTSGPGIDDMTTIDSTDLPDITAAIAHVAAHFGDRRGFGSLSYDRTVDTNVLGDVIREDRFTASGQLIDQQWSARGAAFVSRARYYLTETTRADERIAGVSFTGAYGLGHQLSLGVTLEVAVGLIERDPLLEGHALPRGARAYLTLSTTRTLWEY
ncbi:MAG: hypothetical protein JNL83_21445 [Myxococcales bacterium]|nr:hypothetical protein [Myxococcales bacterium]